MLAHFLISPPSKFSDIRVLIVSARVQVISDMRMFLFKRFGVTGTLHCIKCANVRFINTQEAVTAVNIDDKAYRRKHLKPLSIQEKKPWTDNFVANLFAGSVNKSIFEYPPVIRDEALDLVLNHSSEVEGFMNDNPNCLLTEDILQKLKKLELFGLSVPQKYGGSGYNNTESEFLMECTGVNPALGRFIGYNEDFGCKILSHFGSEEQKEKYLPKLAAGESFISFAYLENGPLSDLSYSEGYAMHNLEKRHYVLRANKKWVHNADKSDLFLVFVKLATINEVESRIPITFKIFIVERNTPGVTVHKLLYDKADKAHSFDVTFDDVIVSEKNLLGNTETDGLSVLKFGLANCFATDAVLSLSILKEFIFYAMQFIQEKSLNDPSVKGHCLIQNNLSSLIARVYALESVVYLLTGRSDLYENPDLFLESILVKILAVEFLQSCIKTFIEIVGRDALIKSGVLDKAVDVLQYYSVFDENITYLKLLASSDGLTHAAPSLSKRVLALRRPYENYTSVFKEMFQSNVNKIKKPPPRHNFKMEVHASLAGAAQDLEEMCEKLECAIKDLFLSNGSLALESEHIVSKLAEMAAYIYGSLACISRASSAVCYDFENFDNDLLITEGFLNEAKLKIQQLVLEETVFIPLQENYRRIGKLTFTNKCYPAEHPLSRTY